MTRLGLSIALVAGLAGCGMLTGEGGDYSQPPPEIRSLESAPANAPAGDAACELVARQRAADAVAYGFDDDSADAIRDGAYADCATWKAAHPGRDAGPDVGRS